jgi:hypothetical protein
MLQIVTAALSSAAVATSVQIVVAVFVLVAIAVHPQLMSSPSAAVTCQDSLELPHIICCHILLLLVSHLSHISFEFHQSKSNSYVSNVVSTSKI